MNRLYLALTFILCLLFSGQAFSSHIRAGEITAKRDPVNPLRFEFTLNLYIKKSSNIDQSTAALNFGDGTVVTVNRQIETDLGNDTKLMVYKTVHTFQTVGFYRVSFLEIYRNADIRNITGSGEVTFYLETAVFIDPFVGINNSPVLNVPPIDFAVVGQTYIHNPGAFDSDGDSISYRMSIPKSSATQNVPGYRPLEHPDFGNSTFSLNPVTGDIIWESPQRSGTYNIAFLIEEWRNGIRIGYITRDMQIIVEVNPNRKPVLQVPADTCVSTGSFINKTITATDPDIRNFNPEKIKLTYFGTGQLLVSPSTFTVSPEIQASPASGQYQWNTVCEHVRREPYQVIFKAEDQPPAPNIRLTDLKNWFITVVGAKPTGLQATPLNRQIKLDWDPYSCPNASRMVIYRKECDSTGYVPKPCDKGIPSVLGYKAIGSVNINTTSFIDDGQGRDLSKGSYYCYMIMAEFPAPGHGLSYPSEEACAGLVPDEPLLTNVDVILTHETEGKIEIKWINPLIITGGPAYYYELYRAEGYRDGNYELVFTSPEIMDIANHDNADNVFEDFGLNTSEKVYNYRIRYYNNNGELKGISESASSVFISGSPGDRQAFLNWRYDVPWDNSGQYHYIYRRLHTEQSYNLKDSVFVSTGDRVNFTDSGLSNKDTVCYYVETLGEYCKEEFNEVYRNRSQEVCVVPRDTLPPCPPILSTLECATLNIYFNDLQWINSVGEGCTNDIEGYNIYYSQYEDEDLGLLISSEENNFAHVDSVSTAGCYAITSKNYYGRESQLSNRVCVDICPDYKFPNLITPNFDGLNDFFIPINEPWKVESVKFSVFNRWGALVFLHEGDININWDGNSNNGTVLSDGIYFYHAEVTYNRRLRREDQVQHIKGWVHLMDRDIPKHD